MRLDPRQKCLIERIVNAYETGKKQIDYGSLSIHANGPHGVRQITYGKCRAAEFGSLRELVVSYCKGKGSLRQDFSPYLDHIGATPLAQDAHFKSLLRKVGRKDPLMQRLQNELFDETVFQTPLQWATDNGFTLPLSMLVIYDSFRYSGAILWSIRQKFHESPPAFGGSERMWIRQYVVSRHEWLACHPKKQLYEATLRTADFMREMVKGNWELERLPYLAGDIPIL